MSSREGIWCDNCQVTINDNRFKCLTCKNYDLCFDCFQKGTPFHDFFHDKKNMHTMTRLRPPRITPSVSEVGNWDIDETPVHLRRN